MLTSIHEISFIESFITKEKRERYQSLLGGDKKRRQKILSRLAHNKIREDIIPKYMESLSDRDDLYNIIAHYNNIGDIAYIFSEDPWLDQVTLPLREAINMVMKSDYGSIISFIPGQLAYYNTENYARECALLTKIF